jgi:hypothetical protein
VVQVREVGENHADTEDDRLKGFKQVGTKEKMKGVHRLGRIATGLAERA